MTPTTPRFDPRRAWAVTVAGLAVAVILGSLLFPRRVYDGFLWRYFWGPVDADAHGAVCAVREGGTVTRLMDGSACQAATGVVAEPGYTVVSTVSYAIVLLLALVGVYFFLERYGVGEDRGFFFALLPFMLFGGALRVVEDVNVVLLAAGEPIVPFPWSGLIISPFIYFSVFFLTVGALLLAVWSWRGGYTDGYERPLFAFGVTLILATLAFHGWAAITRAEIGFNPAVPAVVLGGSAAIAGLVWYASERYRPSINAGTGLMGPVLVWGHSLDGIANVLSLDWAEALGLPSYTPKHVVNRAVIDVTGAIQPTWLSDLVGTAWPFLLLKVAVAVAVVWVFDAELFEESPRYGLLLLVAILAVGLGPGTRDMLRATLGI